MWSEGKVHHLGMLSHQTSQPHLPNSYVCRSFFVSMFLRSVHIQTLSHQEVYLLSFRCFLRLTCDFKSLLMECDTTHPL